MHSATVRIFLLLFVLTALPAFAGEDEWRAVIHQVVEQMPKREAPWRVAVLPFRCGMPGYEDQISTLSVIIEDRVRAAVSQEKSLQLITRDAIKALMEEGAFQSMEIVDPESWTKVNVKGVQAVVGGRWTYLDRKLNVSVRLVVTDGGTTYSSFLELPYVFDPPTGDDDGEILPPSPDKSKANIEKLQAVQRRIPGHDIQVTVWVQGGKTCFQEGELIEYGVRADRDCHLAFVCHEVTGNSIVLFPNVYSKSTYVRRGETVTIPGTGSKGGFQIRIQPPLGADVVQVIACTSRSELVKLVTSLPGYRRMRSFGIEEAPSSGDEPELTESLPIKWGSTHLIVRTFPAATQATRGL